MSLITTYDVVTQTKACVTCKERKSLSEFYYQQRGAGQVTSRCKNCMIGNPNRKDRPKLYDAAMQTKKCSECHQVQHVSFFYAKEKGAGGITSSCKKCTCGPVARRHKQRANPMLRVLTAAARRASIKKISFSLTLQNLPAMPHLCPICEVPLLFHRGVLPKHSRVPYDSPALDRVDNRIGYDVDNVRWLCFECNSRKADDSIAWTIKMLAYMKGQR